MLLKRFKKIKSRVLIERDDEVIVTELVDVRPALARAELLNAGGNNFKIGIGAPQI